jgi:hypothetical protein
MNGWSTPSWDPGLAADPIRRPWNPPSWESDRSWTPQQPSFPGQPELPALPALPPPPPPAPQAPPSSLVPAWEPGPWSPPAWDEPVRPQAAAPDRQAGQLRSPDWSMLDRLGPDRGIGDSTGSWSFVASRTPAEYELPSIDHLPEPESNGRHSRQAGRHSAGGHEAGEDLASERRLYFDLPAEPTGWGGRQPEQGAWGGEPQGRDDQQRWGGPGWGGGR